MSQGRCLPLGMCLFLGLLSQTQAQGMRDPTQPPPEVSQAVPISSNAEPDVAFAQDGVAVIVREGKPFLVYGTRLYAVGQSIGANQIERITETEVWLRRGKELRKVSRFGSIQRQAAPLVSPAQP